MMSLTVVRRSFASLCFLILVSSTAVAQQQKPITAREVVAEIQQHVGVQWKEQTVDTFKAGNPDTPITGIAVTMMATMDVLQRASEKGLNFVITHEPTFYAHLDVPEGMPENDPVWTEKRAFIEKHNMVVWRFHDHWHLRNPDGIQAGVTHDLGWEKFQNPEDQFLFVHPETTLKKFSEEVAKKLNSPIVRVVGDPDMKVTKVGMSLGAAGIQSHIPMLESDKVQVLLIGEVPEWETIEYVADAVAQHRKKALVLIGHIPSEQPGMDEATRWLKTFVTGVPIEFVPTKQPMWEVK